MMFKKILNFFKKSEPEIIAKDDDFIFFTSEEGMTEEESLVAQMMRDNGNSVDFTA